MQDFKSAALGACLLAHKPYAIGQRRRTGAIRGHACPKPVSCAESVADHGGREQPLDRLGIAKAAHAQGAQLAFTYQGDALKKRVEPLAAEVGGLVVGHCDVTDPATLDAAFAAVVSQWGSIDFLLHAIAFSDKDQLTGRYRRHDRGISRRRCRSVATRSRPSRSAPRN